METAWTFYWLDGHKSVLKGETVEEAFNKSYGGGALSAVDFYTEHMTSTHYWVPGGPGKAGSWEKKNSFKMNFEDMKTMDESVLAEHLKSIFNTSSDFTIVYPTKDELTICGKVGLYHPEGYVSAIELVYGEYFDGRYDGKKCEEGDHHFMACAGEYFKPTDLLEALKAFIKRAKSNTPYRASGSEYSTSIQAIAAVQDPDNILY